MTSSIQTVCCCGTENEYVQFEIAPRCTDNSLGCECGSSDPYDYRSTDHGCGAIDPRDYECTETGRTGCSEPGSNDCDSCGAVYLDKNAYKNMVLHTCDGIDWSPSHELSEFFDGWWLAGGSSYTTQSCTTDSPNTDRITTWSDSKPCGSDDDFVKVQSDQCLAPVELDSTDPRNPLSAGTILSTEQVVLSSTRPRDMTAGNITNLNVDTGDAWFAIVFRVQTGATAGRRRIFDQGDDNFGLILDGTTLKACFGSETNSAQEASLATGEWHIVIAKRESGTVSARLNGSDFSTNDVSSTDSISTSEQLKINTIGSGDSRFRGQYGDLIVAGGTIEDDDIEKLEWYLADRFGLLGNLPGGHPYKTEAPQVTELTPKEFTGRLANHVFKINLSGTVVPCKLTGGGCVGPQEYTIGSSCKTITTGNIMKDCAGNVMFYGPSHPSSLNDYGTSDWDLWACRYRFWVNSDPCTESANTDCPESCDDPNDSYDEDFNYISSEYARGLHYLDCDDCSSCNPPDAFGKFLRLSVANCFGNNTYEISSDTVVWQDPVNLLYGQTNYTNQTRCTKEFDGEPGDCCGSDGSSSAPFVGSINASQTSTCQTTCLNSSFQTITHDSPFSNCVESEYTGGFCNPGLTVNSCCFDDVQPKVTALSVNFGSFELIDCKRASYDPPSASCTLNTISVEAKACADSGCIGFGLDDRGIGKIDGGSVVIVSSGTPGSSTFSKTGTSSTRGLIHTTNYSEAEVGAAWNSAACDFYGSSDPKCTCNPPNDLTCDLQDFNPMQNGIHKISLTCDNIGDDSSPLTTELVYVVTINLAFATSVGDFVQIPDSSLEFKYQKISTSYDATGTYSLASSMGADLERFNHPSTITVT